MRVMMPGYGVAPGVLVTDDDYVVGPGRRVAHKHPDGSWVRINEDGTVGKTPETATPGVNEIAMVGGSRGSDELRSFCPDPASGKVFTFRMTDKDAVP